MVKPPEGSKGILKNLDNNNAVYVSEIRGTKREMHYWQHEKIIDYMYVADQRPPLNKSTW